jgi:large subunit ribosomal protein L6
MSRIGRLPILLPKGVSVNMDSKIITVKGPHGSLERELPDFMEVEIFDDRLLIKPKLPLTNVAKRCHGLFRTLINNMVIGVSEKFQKELELKGVGYRCQVNNKEVILNLGYSHPIQLIIPDDIEVKVENNTSILVSGIEKEIVGLFASKVRAFRPPEPYNGKGVLYKNETIIRKTGKVGK